MLPEPWSLVFRSWLGNLICSLGIMALHTALTMTGCGATTWGWLCRTRMPPITCQPPALCPGAATTSTTTLPQSSPALTPTWPATTGRPETLWFTKDSYCQSWWSEACILFKACPHVHHFLNLSAALAILCESPTTTKQQAYMIWSILDLDDESRATVVSMPSGWQAILKLCIVPLQRWAALAASNSKQVWDAAVHEWRHAAEWAPLQAAFPAPGAPGVQHQQWQVWPQGNLFRREAQQLARIPRFCHDLCFSWKHVWSCKAFVFHLCTLMVLLTGKHQHIDWKGNYTKTTLQIIVSFPCQIYLDGHYVTCTNLAR